MGEKSLAEALELAEKHENDLVEISPKTIPPVCKIMDYGQFLYQRKKSDKKAKKKQKQTEVKGIRLSFRISQHDIDIKANQAKKFLELGHLIRVQMQIKGREMSHSEIGLEKLKSFAEYLSEISNIEQEPTKQGNQFIMVLTPKKS